MRFVFLVSIAFMIVSQPRLYSQTVTTPKLYAHKVIVEEIVQTKSYTYLHVKERIKDADSLQWLALPQFEPAVGDIFYYESGLQMGEFQSKELNRTFKEITFLGGLSTSPEISDKNIVSGLKVSEMDSMQSDNSPAEIHTVVVQEVLQAGGYTYLRVKEGDKEDWLAVVKVSATVGQTYTYDDAALMTDFTSKELKRTFKEVLFVANLRKPGEAPENNEGLSAHSHGSHAKPRSEVNTENNNVKIESVEGRVSIATLFENKKTYEGKIIVLKGEVTKFSSGILGKNWIHIKDGSSFSGKSDLTITSDQTVRVGDKIFVEGRISLDKDFGSGYFFDVIMEDAKVQTE